MKNRTHSFLLATIILTSSLSSGCALLAPLMGMIAGTGLNMTAQDSAQASTPYRATTNAVSLDGSNLYGFYSEKTGASQ